MVDIEQNIEEPDIVFVEGGSGSQTRQQEVKLLSELFLRAPVFAFTFGCYIYILLGAFGRFISIVTGGKRGNDTEIANRISSRYDIKTCEVDRVYIARPIYNHPIFSALFNWMTVAATAYFSWNNPFLLGSSHLTFLYLALLFGVLHIMIIIAIVNATREEKMIDVICSKSISYDSACLITGSAHHYGIGQELSNNSSINVINPQPEGLNFVIKKLFSVVGELSYRLKDFNNK
jgi:hypothetical protein